MQKSSLDNQAPRGHLTLLHALPMGDYLIECGRLQCKQSTQIV